MQASAGEGVQDDSDVAFTVCESLVVTLQAPNERNLGVASARSSSPAPRSHTNADGIFFFFQVDRPEEAVHLGKGARSR